MTRPRLLQEESMNDPGAKINIYLGSALRAKLIRLARAGNQNPSQFIRQWLELL